MKQLCANPLRIPAASAAAVLLQIWLILAGSQHAAAQSGTQLRYTVTDLGTLGGDAARPHSINKSGQIVGFSTLPGEDHTHAFLYQNGSMIDLGTLGGDRPIQ